MTLKVPTQKEINEVRKQWLYESTGRLLPKSDTGMYLIAPFFIDLRSRSSNEDDLAFLTLNDEHKYGMDGKVYLSLRKLYLESDDPTEYEFATAVFGSWEHWQKIANSGKVKPLVKSWRAEQEVKLRSKGIKATVGAAVDGNVNAAKFLATAAWKPEGSKRGRPTTEEVVHQHRVAAGLDKEMSDWMDVLEEVKTTRGNA